MKKWTSMLFLTFLAAVLVACGQNADSNEGNEEANANAENEEDTEELSAKDVYQKAMEASADMESAEVEMDMDQTMEFDDGESMTTSTSSTMEMVMDPVAFYQEATTSMDMGEETMDTDTEMYFVDDELYMYESEMDEWMKLDSSMMGDLSEMMDQQDPEAQLKMLEDAMSEFDMEETDDTYVLEIAADGDEFTELVQELAEESMPPEMLEEMEAEGIDLFDQMDINGMEYELTLDKESFDVDNLKMDMDMDMEIEDEKVNTKQEIDMDYISINEVDEIELPEDVEDEAMDEEELQEQVEDELGDDFEDELEE